ncbi:MAG: hypothetical protein HKL85_04310 [Acidimicrobiaceae bacterium]|nr:hypothetical protein [Acidimicrobiaceae bacterium]
MSDLLQRRLSTEDLRELVELAPAQSTTINEEHRASLASRFRAVPNTEHRRLDAWMVEQAGRTPGPFAWSPATARRILGNNALRRVLRTPDTILNAVRDEIADQLLRSVKGYARSGSLGHWLAGVSHPVLGLITAEAVNWATQTLECVRGLSVTWRVPASDVYYDVAAARTTLRGRRDVVIGDDAQRVVVRIRSGSPGKSAGPGLRSDLVVETLAHPEGLAPRRYLGLWPDAGLILGVEGTMENVRSGARDFIRAAVVQRRHNLVRVV